MSCVLFMRRIMLPPKKVSPFFTPFQIETDRQQMKPVVEALQSNHLLCKGFWPDLSHLKRGDLGIWRGAVDRRRTFSGAQIIDLNEPYFWFEFLLRPLTT